MISTCGIKSLYHIALKYQILSKKNVVYYNIENMFVETTHGLSLRSCLLQPQTQALHALATIANMSFPFATKRSKPKLLTLAWTKKSCFSWESIQQWIPKKTNGLPPVLLVRVPEWLPLWDMQSPLHQISTVPPDLKNLGVFGDHWFSLVLMTSIIQWFVNYMGASLNGVPPKNRVLPPTVKRSCFQDGWSRTSVQRM